MAPAHELNNSNETWAHTAVDMIYGFVPATRETEEKNTHSIERKWNVWIAKKITAKTWAQIQKKQPILHYPMNADNENG